MFLDVIMSPLETVGGVWPVVAAVTAIVIVVIVMIMKKKKDGK